MAEKAAFSLPVAVSEDVSMPRGRLWLVVALQAEIVVGAAQAMVSWTREILGAAGMFDRVGSSKRGRGSDGGGGGGGWRLGSGRDENLYKFIIRS